MCQPRTGDTAVNTIGERPRTGADTRVPACVLRAPPAGYARNAQLNNASGSKGGGIAFTL